MLYCEENFDVRTMELVGIFVKKYRCFENQFFSLHPLIKGHVSKKKGEHVIHLDDNKEFDLFREKKLNVMALCGKNGSGKTTLINQIREDYKYRGSRILFFVDAQKCIATSEVIDVTFDKHICKIDNTIDFNVDELLSANRSERHFNDYRGFDDLEQIIFDRYLENPSLFSFENDSELLTHYEIRLDPDDIRSSIQHYLEDLSAVYSPPQNTEDTLFDLCRRDIDCYDHYLTDYPLYALVLFCLNKIRPLSPNNEKINFNPFSISPSLSLEKINEKIGLKIHQIAHNNAKLKTILFSSHKSHLLGNRLPYKRWKIEFPNKIKKQREWLKKVVYDTLRDILKNMIVDKRDNEMIERLFYDFISKHKNDFFYLIPYKVMNNGIRRLSDLSEGQKRSLINRQLIFDNLKNEKYTIVFDEPENAYHPEMSRWFWADLVKEVEFTKNYLCNEIQTSNIELSEKKIKKLNERYVSIIVATHSPFLLSDLFRHNILALDNQGDGFVREVNIRNTFAGNIAEILCDSMFMNGMVGAFAEEQIQSLFRKKIKNESDLNHRNQLVEQIGDPILKNILKGELTYER